MRPTIVVLGANTFQGAGVMGALYADPSARFEPRAVPLDGSTQDVWPYGRLPSADELTRAFVGASSVFVPEPTGAQRALALARVVCEAAARAGVGHILWAVHDANWTARQGGQADPDRAGLERNLALASLRESRIPVTTLRLPYIWENLMIPGAAFRRTSSGTYGLVVPSAARTVSGQSLEIVGQAVLDILENGSEYVGHHVIASSEEVSAAEMARTLSNALGLCIDLLPAAASGVACAGGAERTDDAGPLAASRSGHDAGVPTYRLEVNPADEGFGRWALRFREELKACVEASAATGQGG